ncbi:MAG: hypothetical protein J1E41_07945, partial [Ruminococcus sp.]|nr:hypothetical protein [Ruminococcus sp.]
MIKIADNDFSIKEYIDNLSSKNPFGCRIKALYNTYDYSLAFVDYWVQLIENVPVSLISRLDSSFVLFLTDSSDLEEISSFIRVSGAENVICDAKYELNCSLKKVTGPIFVSEKTMENERNFNVFNPHIKDVYNLISKCRSENFLVPSYESFALDIAHRINKKTVRIYGIGDTKLISCIMTLAESDDGAVLGALATDPDFRRL